jgi:hypothetical protein
VRGARKAASASGIAALAGAQATSLADSMRNLRIGCAQHGTQQEIKSRSAFVVDASVCVFNVVHKSIEMRKKRGDLFTPHR